MNPTPAPSDLFLRGTRVLFVFAHQDDEVGYAGLIQRAPADARFVWVTNGAGMAEAHGLSPVEYANARRMETTVAMDTLGIGRDRLRFLGNSEDRLYKALVHQVSKPNARHETYDFVRAVAAQVAAEVRSLRPDVVFTLAWQGGHPLHDLVHLCVRAAIRDLPDTRLYELPQYELANTVALRFAPWHKDPVHEVRLTPTELAAKRRMLACYPTQAGLIRTFQRVITVTGLLARVAGRGFTYDQFAAVEPFGPVPRDRDYRHSPHGLDLLDYIGDDCEGVGISYETMIAPLAGILL